MYDAENQTNIVTLADTWELAFQELLSPYPSIKPERWPVFNEITGGLRAREFTILCGGTGVGKTQWLANLSMHLLLQKTKHYIASVETGRTDFVKRVVSAMVQEDLNNGDAITRAKSQEIYKNYGNVFKSNDMVLSLHENRITVKHLIDELTKAHYDYGARVAILDNLNFFMEVTSGQNQIVEMDRTIHDLIIFCKNIDMHIIMVMHPKKTEGGRIDSELDIKGSSTAVQEAHNVLLFNRIHPNNIQQGFKKDCRELTIAKLRRRGKYVGKTILYNNIGTYYDEYHEMLWGAASANARNNC